MTHFAVTAVCLGSVAWAVWASAVPVYAESGTGESRTWRYGATVDLSYPVDFNFPENHRWRSKTTTPRVNEFTPNVAMGYVKKEATV